MKYTIVLIGVCLFLAVTAFSVSAHDNGIPFIKVNGDYVRMNQTVIFTGAPAFAVAAHVAPQTYVMGENLTFSLNENLLANPYDFERQYRWNFGDDTTQTDGAEVSHTYSKPGTYITQLYVQFAATSKHLLTDNMQITILPEKGYQLPAARIRINGKEIRDVTKDIQYFQNGEKITFDASGSTGNKLTYQWDFGDDAQSTEKVVTHRYAGTGYMAFFPILRVTDDQGIATDAAAFVESNPTVTVTPTPGVTPQIGFLQSIVLFFLRLFALAK